MAFISNYALMNETSNNNSNEKGSDDDIFIDLVKSHPCLYDKTNKYYHDKNVRANAWKTISDVLDSSEQVCEARWIRLKAKYHNENMIREKETRSGSAASKRIVWPAYQQMRSLFEKEISSRYTVSNLPGVDKKSPSLQSNYSRAPRKKFKEDYSQVSAAAQEISETIHEFKKAMENSKYPDVKCDCDSNSDKLFSKLVTAELHTLKADVAKKKYKKIMQYLIELD